MKLVCNSCDGTKIRRVYDSGGCHGNNEASCH